MSLDPRQEETEVNESSELEQQEVVQPKREWKKILALVLTMVVAVACFSLAYSALYEAFFGGSSNQAVVSLSKDNHKNHAKEYVKNLKEVNRDEDLIDVYLDEGVDGYYITLFNSTDSFVSGKITLFDGSKKVSTIDVELVKPYGYISISQSFDTEPTKYKLSNVDFYHLEDETIPTFEASFDYDEDYNEWVNVALGDQCSIDHVKEVAQYMYRLDVLANQDYETLFFYDDTVEYFEEFGQTFYDTATVQYVVTIDTVEETILFYGLADDEWVEIDHLSMK